MAIALSVLASLTGVTAAPNAAGARPAKAMSCTFSPALPVRGRGNISKQVFSLPVEATKVG